MSTFEVKVVKIDAIEPIEGADAIELAKIADYRSVVRKGDFKAGDLAVYIPEASIVPAWLLQRMGLEGKLAGSEKNRVKAMKLRGCLSQGLLYQIVKCNVSYHHIHTSNDDAIKVTLGQDVAEILGITKYEPVIPASMAGEVCNIGSENTVKYDIENLKKYPDIFVEGEEVVVTEKLHGTFCMIGYIPGLNHPELFENGEVFTASKGLGAQGLVFKNNENNKHNVYVSNLTNLLDGVGSNIITAVKRAFDSVEKQHKPFYIMGEIFGGGVQDLTYGINFKNFRVFDIYVGKPGEGKYLDYANMVETCEAVLDLGMVPVLYKGPYSRAKMDELCAGNTVEGKGTHIREGIVIKPVTERKDDTIGRVFLKHINPDYLLRKGNATEFQ